MCGIKPNRSHVDGMKTCNDCKEVYPANLDYFYSQGIGKNNLQRLSSYCKSCMSIRDKARSKKDGINRRKSSKYKVPHEIIVALHNKGCCQICGNNDESAFAIDHCHLTGKVRDLLCRNCNLALGYVNDNPEILIKMVEYLRFHKEAT